MNGLGRTITVAGAAILAYCGIVGLILTGHSNLRAEIGTLRAEHAEMRAEHADIRLELRAEDSDIRTVMRSEHADIRAELRTALADFRSAMRAEHADIRSQMNTALEGIRADIRQIRDHLYAIGVAEESEDGE